MSRDCGLILDRNRKVDMELYSRNCMISNAVKEIFHDTTTIYHQRDQAPRGAAIKIREGGCMFILPLPSEVYRRMVQFDAGFKLGGLEQAHELRDEIEPFEFELNIPKRLIHLIGINQVYKILSESKILELAKAYETV